MALWSTNTTAVLYSRPCAIPSGLLSRIILFGMKDYTISADSASENYQGRSCYHLHTRFLAVLVTFSVDAKFFKVYLITCQGLADKGFSVLRTNWDRTCAILLASRRSTPWQRQRTQRDSWQHTRLVPRSGYG